LAISPVSDLVLDVVRAADPAKVKEAHRQLLDKSSTGQQTAFELAAGRPVGARVNIADTDGIPQSYQDFEAMVLQTFIQSMLPNDTQTLFGEGTAGDVWKSMMAEQLGKVMADGGGIGIARQLAEDRQRAEAAQQHSDISDNKSNIASSLVQQIQMSILRDTAMRPDTAIGVQGGGSST
jgi:Rod binding domain-containing protein